MSWNKELVHCQYYWMRMKNNPNIIGAQPGVLLLGQYDAITHTMGLSGNPEEFLPYEFDVLGPVEPYKEK